MATGERHDTCLLRAAERTTPCSRDDLRAHARPESGVIGHGERRDGSPVGEIGGAPG